MSGRRGRMMLGSLSANETKFRKGYRTFVFRICFHSQFQPYFYVLGCNYRQGRNKITIKVLKLFIFLLIGCFISHCLNEVKEEDTNLLKMLASELTG